MEDEERKVDLSHRTIQDEQARLRKKRQKAENVFAVFKKPLHESLTSVLPVMLIVLVLCFTCLLYTSPSPRDISGSRMPSSA